LYPRIDTSLKTNCCLYFHTQSLPNLSQIAAAGGSAIYFVLYFVIYFNRPTPQDLAYPIWDVKLT